jgi:hypothetical protein
MKVITWWMLYLMNIIPDECCTWWMLYLMNVLPDKCCTWWRLLPDELRYNIYQVQHLSGTTFIRYNIHQVQHSCGNNLHQVQHLSGTTFIWYNIHQVITFMRMNVVPVKFCTWWMLYLINVVPDECNTW